MTTVERDLMTLGMHDTDFYGCYIQHSITGWTGEIRCMRDGGTLGVYAKTYPTKQAAARDITDRFTEFNGDWCDYVRQ